MKGKFSFHENACISKYTWFQEILFLLAGWGALGYIFSPHFPRQAPPEEWDALIFLGSHRSHLAYHTQRDNVSQKAYLMHYMTYSHLASFSKPTTNQLTTVLNPPGE